MEVFARLTLLPSEPPAEQPALLLEGDWPHSYCGGAAFRRWSLDTQIDARQGWIDEEASRLASRLSCAACPADGSVAADDLLPGPAYLHELKLRYYLVKLLRVVAFFHDAAASDSAVPLRAGAKITFHAARHRDEDYADLLRSIAAVHDWRLDVIWRDESGCEGIDRPECLPQMSRPAPANAWWRQAASAVAARCQPRLRRSEHHVVLCGDRRVLEPVCRELVRRGVSVAWLYDRFAVRTFLRWRLSGVRQLVCRSGAENDTVAEPLTLSLPGVTCRGVDLTLSVARWLHGVQQTQGDNLARLCRRIAAHFAEERPTHLLLDEDATPMPRAAIAAARRHGIPAAVVQHGVPRVRFGFAPLAADAILAWGDASRRQLLRFGIPAERIRVTGHCGLEHRGLARESRPIPTSNSREILFIATTPPADERPDAVNFHLTSRTHEAMLRMACQAVAEIAGTRLTIKLHPRCRDDVLFRRVAAEYPQVHWRIVRRPLSVRQIRRVACVINCTSGAGPELARQGIPVIELIPAGSLDLLPAQEWGAIGTAHDLEELRLWLRTALNRPPQSHAEMRDVFASVGSDAARRVVDELLARSHCEDAPANAIPIPTRIGNPQPETSSPQPLAPNSLVPDQLEYLAP